MNRRRVIGVGCAVVLAGLGAVGVVSWASSTKSSAEDQQSQTAVVIVDKHVPKGADAATILAGTHEGTVQQKNLARGALTSESQVGTQVASADLYPGDQLVKDRLATKVDNGLPAGSVEYGVKLDAEAAVGGLVKAGDQGGRVPHLQAQGHRSARHLRHVRLGAGDQRADGGARPPTPRAP